MKKFVISAMLIAVAVSGLFAFDGYVDIKNDTGYVIYYIYVSHADQDTWGDDMLGDDVLADGDTYRVYLSGHPSSVFDIMVEDEDGDTYTFYDVDVEYADITVTLADLDSGDGDGESVGEVTVNGPGGDFDGYVMVTNSTGYDGYYLYVKQGGKSWGPDLLGDNILPDGSSFTVNVRNFPNSVFDIRLEDEDGDTYTFNTVDIETEDVHITLDNLD